MRGTTKSLLWLLMAGTLLGSAGCIFSPDSEGPGDREPPPPPPFPEDPDILMGNFKRAYGEMDQDLYREVLHNDYQFIFQQSDVEHLGLPSDRLTKEEEMVIANHMFNQHGGTENHPITKISIDVLDPETSWQQIVDDLYFPNSQRRVYRITMTIERPTSTTLEVQGLVEFYAVSRDSAIEGGSTLPYWQLLGQIDRTVSKALPPDEVKPTP